MEWILFVYYNKKNERNIDDFNSNFSLYADDLLIFFG